MAFQLCRIVYVFVKEATKISSKKYRNIMYVSVSVGVKKVWSFLPAYGSILSVFMMFQFVCVIFTNSVILHPAPQ